MSLVETECRTYKVISWWNRQHFTNPTKKDIPTSITLLVLHFIGSEYCSIPIERTAKGIFIGSHGAGKTSLITRFCQNTFTENFISTIGIDFQKKTMQIQPYNSIKYLLWDTAGRERFQRLIPNYYRGAAMIFIVFDLTDNITFEHAQRFFEEALAADTMQDEALVVFIGNKLDLCDVNKQYTGNESYLNDRRREVELESVHKYIDGQREKHAAIFYWETSAKTNLNVDEMFAELSEKLISRFRMQSKEESSSKAVDLNRVNDANRGNRNSSCCFT